MTVEITTQSQKSKPIGRTSPLQGYAGRLAELPQGVTVREVPFLTQLDVRVDPAGPEAAEAARVLGVALPTTANTAVSGADGVEVLWLGPDEWLVVAPPDQAALEPALREALGSAGVVVDVSAHRTTIAVSGPLTRDVLARGCSLDLDPRVSPAGTCVQTLLALTGVVLVVRDDVTRDGGGEVRLLVRSSFARYLADWLLDACREYEDDSSWQ
ncbi:sarcosine oxidase subunit gamma [Pedococcus sp. NPDC057267]|uniref:sarcosine oxidase subunit gamma n=1 Tax=Pedococcus sp. NPDC057267 TaxID=3346077 RepID=UPI00364199FC